MRCCAAWRRDAGQRRRALARVLVPRLRCWRRRAGGRGAGAGEPFHPGRLNRHPGRGPAQASGQVQRVEKTLEEVPASKNLTIQEREQLAQQLEDLRKETRTKEQQLAHEKKQLEEQVREELTDEEKAAEAWEQSLPRRHRGAGLAWTRPSAAMPSTPTRSWPCCVP